MLILQILFYVWAVGLTFTFVTNLIASRDFRYTYPVWFFTALFCGIFWPIFFLAVYEVSDCADDFIDAGIEFIEGYK